MITPKQIIKTHNFTKHIISIKTTSTTSLKFTKTHPFGSFKVMAEWYTRGKGCMHWAQPLHLHSFFVLWCELLIHKNQSLHLEHASIHISKLTKLWECKGILLQARCVLQENEKLKWCVCVGGLRPREGEERREESEMVWSVVVKMWWSVLVNDLIIS